MPVRVTLKPPTVVDDPSLPIRTDDLEAKRFAHERKARQHAARQARIRRQIRRAVKRLYRTRQRAGLCRCCGRPRERLRHRCNGCQEVETRRQRNVREAARGQDWRDVVSRFEARIASFNQ